MRIPRAVIAGLVLVAACSSGDSSPPSLATDPVITFCERFDTFAAFSNQDREPTEELVAELLRLQADVDEVVPSDLAGEWRTLDDWYRAFIAVLERDGYGPVTEDTFVAAFGDMNAAEAAAERTEAAYQAFYDWQDANCPVSDGDQAFCAQWPPYAELIDSDQEPTRELVAEVLAMEEGLGAVAPSDIEGDLAAIVEWNARIIAWLDRNDYRLPTTDEEFLEIFDGDEALATQGSESFEAAFGNIEAWLTANCGTGGADPSSTTLPVRFCAAWDEFVALTADDAELDEAQYEELQGIVARAGEGVPAAVADHWAAIADFVDGYGAVLVTVEFRAERITDELLEQAFGSVEAYDQAVVARDAAGEAIGQWSLEGCGDFCARWPQMARITEEVGYWLQWVVDDPENGPDRLEDHLRTLAVLDQLAPAEIRDSWTTISGAYQNWVDQWERAGFDPETLEEVREAEILDWVRNTPYLAARIDFGEDSGFYARVLEAWQGGATEIPEWVYEEWVGGELDPERIDEIRAEIEASDPFFHELVALFEHDDLPGWLREVALLSPADLTIDLMGAVEAWVDANCGGTTSRPGTLRVRWPRVEGLAGGMAILALVPRGGSYADLADVPSTIVAQCEPISRDPWGVWMHEPGHEERQQSDFFRDERWSDDRICGFLHEAGPPRIDAGAYTLVGGIMWGSPGDPAEGIHLVSCLTVDVQIDADTIVDLPPFEPCDVRVGDGDPDPWRHPPTVDPATPGAGTLRVDLPNVGTPSPYEEHYAGLELVVLPAGTTLNQIGREQLWPVGAASTHLLADREADAIASFGSVQLPVSPVPPSGRPVGLDPDWLSQRPSDDQLPLAVLAPGVYDVYVQVWIHIEEEGGGEARMCGRTEAKIDGDTVIALPELEECP